MWRSNWLRTVLFVVMVSAFLSPMASAEPTTILVPDYMLTDAEGFGIRTFTWVHGKTGSFTSRVTGSEVVTFGNGQNFEGVWTSNSEHDGDRAVLAYVGEERGQVLAFGHHYLSDDASMYAPSSRFSFGQMTIGLAIQVPDYYYEIPSGGGPVILNQDMPNYRLATIQDVTVPYASFEDCLVTWELVDDQPYIAPDLDGLDVDLGISVPTSVETGARAIEEFQIFAPGFGDIAFGYVVTTTGMLSEMYVLTDCRPVPEPTSLGLLSLGVLALIQKRRRPL